MVIDTAVWERDLQSNRDDLPVVVKFNRRLYNCALSAGNFTSTILDGGLPENANATLTFVRSEIQGRLPKHRDLMNVQQKDGTWMEFEVKDLPDLVDPNSVSLTAVVGNPEQ